MSRVNKYSKQSAITGKATDDKIAERIGKWNMPTPDDIKVMYPKTSPEVLAEITGLHADIAKSTSKTQKLTAVKRFAKGATKAAKKAFEAGAKLALSLAIVCLLSNSARAEIVDGFDTSMPEIIEVESPLPVVFGLDLNSIFKKTKAGAFIGFDGNDYAVICASFISYPNPKWSGFKREYININLGGARDTGGGDLKFHASAGLRIDSLFKWFSESKFAQKYLLFAILPPLETGIGGQWIAPEGKISPGFTVLSRF